MDRISHAKAMAFYGLIAVSLIELLRQRQSQGGPWLRANRRQLEGATASQSSLGMRTDVRMGSFLFRQFTAVWNFFWPLQPSQRPRGDPIWVRPLFHPNNVRGLRVCVSAHHHFIRNGVAKFSAILEKKGFRVFKVMRRSISFNRHALTRSETSGKNWVLNYRTADKIGQPEERLTNNHSIVLQWNSDISPISFH